MDGGAWWAAVHGVTEGRTRLSDFTFTFHFHALEKEMATHSSVLAWRIPWTEKPGRLQSMGLHRVGHDWSDLVVVVVGSGQTGDGKSEHRHFRNQWTKMDWNGWIKLRWPLYLLLRAGILGRNGVAIMVNKRVWNAVLGCNIKNDRVISVRVQGKSFNVTIIKVYAPTTNAEEADLKTYKTL